MNSAELIEDTVVDTLLGKPRITTAFLKTIATALDHEGTMLCGADFIELTKISRGTMYPLLKQMRIQGWMECEWEQLKDNEDRPPRRMYRLTPAGKRAGIKVLGQSISPKVARMYNKLIPARSFG